VFAVSFANRRNLFTPSMSPMLADATDAAMWGWVWKEGQASAPKAS
jgi:hypothetical protein